MKRSLAACVVLLISVNAVAYDPVTHGEMSRKAVAASVLATSSKPRRMGLLPLSVVDVLQSFPTLEGDPTPSTSCLRSPCPFPLSAPELFLQGRLQGQPGAEPQMRS